ncbi:actin-dependent regulator of chromatin subfamily A [Cryptosporidium felis]|nr:actin-dependent regulator of chromatin subfamily A [Cryptosporidium felis]
MVHSPFKSKKQKFGEKFPLEDNWIDTLACRLEPGFENKPNIMNSSYPPLFGDSDKEEEELKKGFKRLVRRKRNVRNLSDSSSASLSSVESSVKSDATNDFDQSSHDDEVDFEEREVRRQREHMEKEDSALSFCLEVSQRMKKGIVDFFVGVNAENALKNEVTDNIKNGHCNISFLTKELRSGELCQYLNSLGETRLKEYQVAGVSWLLALHQNSYNGILADEMGLGKTAQTCVWLQYLFDTGKLQKPVIISCPASLLENWTSEVAIWAPRLRAIKYHGSQKDRRQIAEKIFEYYEENKVDAIITTFQMLSNKIDINMAFKHFEFSYMIVDEAHNIKNSASQRYKSMSRKIQSERKLLLTGTPISNSISELSNMLVFLMPEIFNSEILEDAFNSYKRQFTPENNKEQANSEVLFLQQVIAPFVLRRSKQDVLSCLPKKHTFIEFCELTELQRAQYNREMNQIYKNKEQDGNEKWQQRYEVSEVNTENSGVEADEHLVTLIRKKIQEKVNSHFEDTQFYTAEIENAPNEQEENSLNSLVVDEFAGHHYDPKYVNSILFRMRRICNHSLLHQGHYTSMEIDKLVDYLSENVGEFKGYSRSRVQQHIAQLCDYEIHQLVCRLLISVPKEGSQVLSSFRISNEFIVNGSCKLIKMSKIIQETVIKNKEKCLIFCHHTMLLDIIEEYIRIKYTTPDFYLRLDGTTPIQERQRIIERFQNTQVPIFLLSTKAAGQGLNLTIASSVIMMDLDYNPQIEKQAEDRVHRIGQNKQVKIFKLVCKDTIEENIFNCCQSKLSLDNAFGGRNQRQV